MSKAAIGSKIINLSLPFALSLPRLKMHNVAATRHALSLRSVEMKTNDTECYAFFDNVNDYIHSG